MNAFQKRNGFDAHCGCLAISHNATANSAPVCRRCQATDLTQFAKNRRNLCRDCQLKLKREDSQSRNRDIEYSRCRHAKAHLAGQRSPTVFLRTMCGKLAAKKLRRGLEFSLTPSILVGMLEAQNGQCAATGSIMDHRYKSLKTISIDRLDNSIGYTENNIRLVCKWVNLGRGAYSLDEFSMVLDDLYDPIGKQKPPTDVGVRQFLSSRMTVIRSKCSCSRRDYDINTDYLYDISQIQSNACYLSGSPLIYASNNLRSCSVDRIDCDKGYVRGNIQLTCLWANIARGTHTSEEFKAALTDALSSRVLDQTKLAKLV